MSTLTYDPTPADQPEFSEEEQESLAVGEQLAQEQNELLAGKFEDAAQLERAYIELQQKLGQKEQPEPEPEVEQEQEPVDDEGNLLDVLWEKAVNKEVTEDLVKKLNDQSPEDLAKMYLDYRQSVENNRQPEASQMTNEEVSQIKGIVGGDENYKQMIEWAGSNLNENEIEMYDSVMDSGNPAAAFFAVQALAARFQDAQGVDGNLITGKAPVSSHKGFRSQAELVAAMSDPRYDNDPAYRDDVMKKLENSRDLAF